MQYKDILRIKPWLRLCNVGNISKRLLKATNGNAFIVYNNIHNEYQLHTVQAELMSGDSWNANLPLDVINQWIIEDYNSTDFEKYVDDIISEKQKSEMINNSHKDSSRRIAILEEQLTVVERVLGTKL